MPQRTIRGLVAAGLLSVSLVAASPALASPPEPPSPPAPTFSEATVHDPADIVVDGVHYEFGSHLQTASTTDLMHFTQLAEGVTPDNPLFDDVTKELADTFAWAQSNTLWAPDVIRLGDGRFYMYYDACKGDSPRSALGVAVADQVTGPYHNLGIILKSGMWGQPSEDGTTYDPHVHPNVVDPDVFFDASGKLWMVYGSYSGGIFILKLDPATGMPNPGQGYGKHLWGGNHARIEGPTVEYNPKTGYYYLFVTYGGLDSTGGYNIRVARSRTPDGPFLDMSGRDMATVKADPTKPLFDDASIQDTGVKLMGNFQFQRVVGDPGTGSGFGYVSPGGSSPYYDTGTGRQFLIFHSRFPGLGEEHHVRVQEMFTSPDGWPMLTPMRYAGETPQPLKRAHEVGTYLVVDQAPKTINATIHKGVTVTLGQEGDITGARTGSWERDGSNGGTLQLGDKTYEVHFQRQWDPDQAAWTTTFTGLTSDGTALFGVQRAQVSPATAVQRVINDLSVPTTTTSNISLPTEGTQGSTISWASSDPAVIATDGTVTRPAAGQPDATVTLTATVTNTGVTQTATFTVTVPARLPGGLVADYHFDGNLADAAGGAAGTVSGPTIGSTGGTISYQPGVSGQAAVFDGKSGVRLPDGLVSGSTWSVSVWLKPSAETTYTTTVFAANSPTSWVSLLPQGHGGVNGDTMIWSGTNWYDAGFGMKLPLNQWSHVAFSVDSGHLVAWVNGTKVVDRTGFPDVLTSTNGVFSLGVNWWDPAYQGAMDEVRFYNAPLTDADVAALAQHP